MNSLSVSLAAAVVLLAALLLWLRKGGQRRLLAERKAGAAQALIAARDVEIINAVTDAVLAVDVEQRIVVFNRAAERLFGCSVAEALGGDLARFIPADLRERHAGHFAAYAEGGVPPNVHREVLALRCDGSQVAVEASVSVVRTPGNGPALYLVALRDLTERKAALADMYRVQERYRSVVEQSPDAIWVAEDGQVVLANRAAVQLVGGARVADVVGRPLADFVPDLAAAAVPRDQPLPLSEHRLRRLDGGQRDVEVSVAQVPDHGSLALQVMMRDIGERKRQDGLREDRERLLGQIVRIAQTVPGAILEWVRHPGGRMTVPFASARFESLFGLDPAAMAVDATPMFAGVHPEDREPLRAELARSGDELRVARFEWRYRHPQHGERWLESRAMPRHEDDGKVVWNAFVMDISERKRAEGAVAEQRVRLLEAERVAKIGHFMLDLRAGTWTLSESLFALLGRPEGARLGYAQGLELVHPADRDGLEVHVRRDVLTGRRPLDHDFRMLRADGGEPPWMHGLGSLQLGADGQPQRVFGTVQDVTERRQATQQIEQSREELRRLSANLNSAREEERRHFSRELHDELGQRLQAIKLEIAALLAAAAPDDDALRDGLRALQRSLDVTVAATRRIAADLRPAMLDDLGLGAAVDWLVRDWSQRARLDIQLDAEPLDDALTDAAATAVYRIVQEGLTNVTRHAHARHVRIALRRCGADLRLAIEDDGFGLAPGDTDKQASHGLVGIRERARSLGGTASIVSPPEGGCRLEVRLPLDRVDSNFTDLKELP